MDFNDFNKKQKEIILGIYTENFHRNIFDNIILSISSISSLKFIPVFVGIILVGYLVINSNSSKLVQNVGASTAISSLFAEVRNKLASKEIHYTDISYLLNEIKNLKSNMKDDADLAKLNLLETRLAEMQRLSLNSSNSAVKFTSTNTGNISIADTRSSSNLEKVYNDILFVTALK